MIVIVAFVAYGVGFLIGQRDSYQAYEREAERRAYWFDRYIQLAEKVATRKK